nr:MAG TPA: hypothetical protein [Caudoviricetes sp.]
MALDKLVKVAPPVLDPLGFTTPEQYGYVPGASSAANATSIMSALAAAKARKCPCKFSEGVYSSDTISLDYAVAVEVAAGAYLDFTLIMQGQHFSASATVNTSLTWADVPVGSTSLAGNFSAFSAGDVVAVSLNDSIGGSASQGNEIGTDIMIVASADSSKITFTSGTRYAYTNPVVRKLTAAVKLSGVVEAGTYSIAGDYTAKFAAGDILRVENVDGTDSVEAHTSYLEFVKVVSVSTSALVLDQALYYTHGSPWLVKTGWVEGAHVSGGGRIKRLELRQAVHPEVQDIDVDRLIYGFTYGLVSSGIYARGVKEPSTINHTYCFGRMQVHNIKAGGSVAVTDNAAIKFMSCPGAQISGLTVTNTAATGSQGDYAVFVDAFYTPYYSWNRDMQLQGVTCESPRSPVTRGVWFYGAADSMFKDIVGAQVFLQGCYRTILRDVVTPRWQMELRDLVHCTVKDCHVKNFTVLGCDSTEFSIRTDGLGTGASLNIAGRFGGGTRNPVTGETYNLGTGNRIGIQSDSTSSSAITLSIAQQDSFIILSGCCDRSTVNASIKLGNNVTNPFMEPNSLRGAIDAGSGWAGPVQKGGIEFRGDYRDGYVRLNGYYVWMSSTGQLRASSTKPSSDSPSGFIPIGPNTASAVSNSSGTDAASVAVNALMASLRAAGILKTS